jgi:thiol-disulfide isomerase/thioredoxin
MFRKIYKLIFIAIIAVSISSVNAQTKLGIGDRAPELKTSKWFKGEPVSRLEKGKIYVIEFWATWCGPCKKSIPHLTEMAHKYKDNVTFIGVDGSEKASSQEEKENLVSDFVKEWGGKMDYNVALDTDDKYMSLNWMKASGQNGIPCAFIVNKELKVVWIGHPLHMENELAKVVEGKYDINDEIKKRTSEEDKNKQDIKEQERFNVMSEEMRKAYKNNNFEKVISECESIGAKEPSYQSKLDKYYFSALARVNADKLLSIAMDEKNKNDAGKMKDIISAGCQIGADKKASRYSIEYLEKKLGKNTGTLVEYQQLTIACENTGNNIKAAEYLEKIITVIKAGSAGNKLDAYIKSLEKKLNELRNNK